MVGGAIPGLVVLDSVKKQAEQAMGSEPGRVRSVLPWSQLQFLPPGSSCLKFLLWIPSVMEVISEL